MQVTVTRIISLPCQMINIAQIALIMWESLAFKRLKIGLASIATTCIISQIFHFHKIWAVHCTNCPLAIGQFEVQPSSTSKTGLKQAFKAARRLRNFASNIVIPNTANDPCENLIQVGTVLIERERRRIIKKLLKSLVKSAERNKRRGNRGMRTCNRMLRIVQG
ncbi:hypothetical protein D917_04995 [Trichinella nativa]|uniref:Uncharacterized protein n=1 Tax=Trichinella nativa TaxID=6335 RepID=A0A1Y3EXI9_9BILA|nr:hypothetical protein D917_04995 [Trichinella nativa]